MFLCVQSQNVELGVILRRYVPSFLYLSAGPFYDVRDRLERMRGDRSAPFPEDAKEKALEQFRMIHDECMATELRASASTAAQMLASIKRGTTRGEIVDLYQELARRVFDELNYQFFLHLTPREACRYENWEQGWESILTRFPETTRDVEEMNRCFALGRYTAAMFHALHVAEWGAVALGKQIGVNDFQKGWGSTEKQLQKIMRDGHSKIAETTSMSFDFLEQMNRQIDSMVLAWRHKVDHAANHLAVVPHTEFTPDVAEHIIGAVRIFMVRLIEGLPQAV